MLLYRFLAVDENAVKEESITVEEATQESAAGRRLWFFLMLRFVQCEHI